MFTVNELIEFLKQYPSDRKIHISCEPDWKTRHTIKELSFVVDMDTNLSHPMIIIDRHFNNKLKVLYPSEESPVGTCPTCNENLKYIEDFLPKHCYNCGRKLDWDIL